MTEQTARGNAVVAIPAHNEAVRLGLVVRGCRALGFPVWVVDDGSTDATAETAQREGAEILRHPANLGKGAAIRTALAQFRGTTFAHLIFMDADGQHDPAHLPAFLQAAESADLVLGNRMSHPAAMPCLRRATNRLMSWILSRICGIGIPDSQCGFRLLSRRFAEAFHPTTSHFEVESEMLVEAARRGFRIATAPIATIYEKPSSHIRPLTDTLRFLRWLLKIYLLPR